MEEWMKVYLFTSVASAEGSWANGIRDLPKALAQELLAGKLACKPSAAPGGNKGRETQEDSDQSEPEEEGQESAGDPGEEIDNGQTGHP
jgi:hypothetical protein